MITIEVSGAEELRLRISSLSQRMKAALERGMKIAMFDLQRYVKEAKLSGQVLKVRTDNLRTSINAQFDSDENTVTGSVGTNVFYGRIHEYGKTVTVPSHSRRTPSGKITTVRQYDATFPERSFLRSSLADRRSMILQTLEDSVQGALDAK